MTWWSFVFGDQETEDLDPGHAPQLILPYFYTLFQNTSPWDMYSVFIMLDSGIGLSSSPTFASESDLFGSWLCVFYDDFVITVQCKDLQKQKSML